MLQLLEDQGEVLVSEVSAALGVSPMTVRRDFQVLAKEGLVKRVHGGAIPVASRSYEPPFAARAQLNLGAKRAIGEAAVALISEGETLVLDVGTTALEVAEALRGRRNLVVLTASLRVLDLLTEEEGIRLMSTGGAVRRGERSLVGELAEQSFAELRFDTFIMGVGGLDLAQGVTEFNPDDARVKKCALKCARRCVVVADHTKLGKVAFSRIGALDDVDVLVTDQDADPEILDGLRSADVEVVIA